MVLQQPLYIYFLSILFINILNDIYTNDIIIAYNNNLLMIIIIYYLMHMNLKFYSCICFCCCHNKDKNLNINDTCGALQKMPNKDSQACIGLNNTNSTKTVNDYK